MKIISFRINRSLKITSIFPALPGMDNVVGKFYYNVLPCLVSREQDPVSKVFKTGRPQEGINFTLFCGDAFISTPVTILPVVASNNFIDEVELHLNFKTSKQNSSSLNFATNLNILASRLAHGVRNPLNAIKGAVVYLQARFSSENGIKEFTDLILSEVDSLDRFVSGIIGSTPQLLDQFPIDIGPIFPRIEKIFNLHFLGLGISLTFDVKSLRLIFANPSQVEYAFCNILNCMTEKVSNGGAIIVSAYTIEKLEDIEVKVEFECKQQNETHFNDLRSKDGEFCLFLAREIIQHQGGRVEVLQSYPKFSVCVFFPAAEGNFRNV